MRALLDVNVLIALLDAAHIDHRPARRWLSANIEHGWASCPITQNGCVRILSQPSYPNTVPTELALQRLAGACATPMHHFWPDDLSLLDADVLNRDLVYGPNQLSDIYLLALATRHGGRFVTFDRKIPLTAVRGARPEHLQLLGV